MTNKYSRPNWDQRKSPDNREIRIIEVRLYSAFQVSDFVSNMYILLTKREAKIGGY